MNSSMSPFWEDCLGLSGLLSIQDNRERIIYLKLLLYLKSQFREIT